MVLIKILIFLIWWAIASYFAGNILRGVFPVEKIYNKILGYFFSIFILGLVANIFTAWLVLNNLTILLSLAIVLIILFFWQNYFKENQARDIGAEKADDARVFHFRKIFFILFGLLAALGWVLIFSARTGNYLVTPWQVISPWYVLIIFLSGLLVYFLVFSRQKTLVIFIPIILFSLLLHSYFLVYEQGFGGDKWRHLGSEYRILRGLEYQPTLLTDNLWYLNIAGVNIPRALIDGPKLSYGFQWSISAILSRVANIDVFYLDQFLGLILFSIFMPIILFIGANLIWPDKKFALLAAALPAMFYVLQYYGGQTLPASYGLMGFAFIIAVWLAYLNYNNRKIAAFAIFITLLMYFNYSLAFILAIIFGFLVLFIKIKNPIKYIGIAFLAAVIFILDWLSAGSKFFYHFNFKDFYVQLIRESNFLYFQAGKFLPFNWDQAWRVSEIFAWLFIILMLIFLGQIMRSKNQGLKFIGWGFIIILINYLLSRHLLAGLHTLSRRLDVFAAVLMVLIFAWGTVYNFINRKILLLASVLFLGLLTTLTYISGPIQEAAVTTNEAKAMKYVWQEIGNSPADYCVLANTWPLLALEAYSAKEVVAGNFPSDYNHQQPERVKLFEEINKNPSRKVLDEVLSVNNKKICFLVLENVDARILNNVNKLLGEPKVFGDNLVWKFNK
ncbi:MAG: hypothetical protein WC610_02255 [Patescibacteria group bacterium]